MTLVGDDFELGLGLGTFDGAFFLVRFKQLVQSRSGRKKERTRRKTNIFEDISATLAFGSLGDLHSVANSNELTIDVLEPGGQSILDRFFDLLLDQSGGQRTKGFVKEIVVRIPNGKLKIADFDMDVLDLEDRGAITSRGVEFNGRLT
jgi:hypothetical protein